MISKPFDFLECGDSSPLFIRGWGLFFGGGGVTEVGAQKSGNKLPH
jgi:hypothetical protein